MSVLFLIEKDNGRASFKCRWTDLAKRRVPASLVIEHFAVVEQLHLRVSVRVEPIGELTLHGGEKALATPLTILARARALATHRDDHALLPLPVLALLIGVHVKTLQAAARDGRLPVTYDTRTTFRRLRARATLVAARAFRWSYYGRTVRPADRRAPLTWASVPDDYDVQIRVLPPSTVATKPLSRSKQTA